MTSIQLSTEILRIQLRVLFYKLGLSFLCSKSSVYCVCHVIMCTCVIFYWSAGHWQFATLDLLSLSFPSLPGVLEAHIALTM